MTVSEQYDLDEYVRPLWTGDTTAHESVLFREDEFSARLVYPADRILAVRSADLKTGFAEGTDYALEDGCLVRLPGSRMPFMPLDEFYPAEHRDGHDFGCTEPGRPFLGFGEGDTMIRHMIDVTYTHSAPWDGPVPPAQTDRLARFLGKLRQGREVTVLFYGDSITTGANSSGTVGVPPFAQPFPEMTAFALAKKYGYSVSVDVKPYEALKPVEKTGGKVLHYVNTAVGGMDSKWGLDNAGPRAADYRPDLMILAFGMNDGWRTCTEFTDLTKQIVASVREASPETDIILLSSILPHWRAKGFFGHQIEYEDGLIAYAAEEEHIAVAPMTGMHRHILLRKEYYHATGNNVNHPSDFMARVYAMVLLATLGA